MTDPTTAPLDVTPIRSLIRRTARLLRSSWVATGMGLTLGLGLGTIALLSLLDLAMPLAPLLRLAALVLVIVPAAWAFLAGVVRPLFRRLRPVQVARRIETHLPGIHNRLVSCIDIENAGKKAHYSTEFYRRLVQEAVERIRGFRPSRVIDGRNLRRALGFAATSLVTFALALGLFSDRIPTALARIFSPFADIPPASGVIYTVEPGDARVLRGEDVSFRVRVERGDPDRLQLEIQPDGKARPLRYDLEKVEARLWRFTLTGFETSFDYRVQGGGTWTTRKRITVVDRPLIVGLGTVLHYPEYMGMPEPKAGPPQIADLTGPVGSTVEVAVDAQGDVATGEIQLLQTRPTRVTVLDRPERTWFQERLPDGAGTEGRWDWDFRLLARPAHTEPAADGVHGHRFQNVQAPFDVRSGEFLFVLVYLDPRAKPEALMVSWHDGSDWEHRAYWGSDTFSDGKPDTASRRRIGPLPPAGQWVRLEAPAQAVDLEGKALRGMGFTLAGGKCYWHRAGALPPSHVEREELYVDRGLPMEPAGPNRWKGRFPLDHETLYRVELRNELGYPSKPMKEAKAKAIPDEPPQVVLERPGGDLVLSTPVKVPLSIAAYDDFGLADIVVSVQRGDSGGFVGRPVHHFERPRRSYGLLTSLDVPAWSLKPGEHIRYRVEARDRKGQSAQTQEFVVRIAADGNAADKQVENFDRNQEGVRQNLERLIEEQAKVQAAVQKMAVQHAALTEKIQTARAQARAEARPDSNDAARKEKEGAPKAAEPLKLDPEAAAQLEAVRREVGQLASREEQNAGLAEQVAGALKQAGEQAADLKMLPSEMLHQLDSVQKAFRAGALQPLRDVAGDLKRGADAHQPAPDLAELQRDTDRIQRQLEAVRNQLAAASKARKELPRNADAAVAGLREDLLRANAGLTERELQELQEAIRSREKELQEVAGQQSELAAATPKAPEVLLPDIERRQGDLEPREDQALDNSRALLEAARAAALRPGEAKPADAQAEAAAEAGEDMAAAGKENRRAREDAGEADAEKGASKGHSGAEQADARRAALQSRQQERIEELDSARAALGREDQAVEGVLGRLRQTLREGPPGATDRELDQLLRSVEVRRALTMAQRGRQLARARQNPARGAAAGFTDRPDQLPTTDKMVAPLDADLPDLDLATRTMILKLQPQIREELLQGLREEGPEGYKGFIRNYFKRLTQVKGNP
jgi:hypothetical protein